MSWITDKAPDTIRTVLVGWWAQDNDHELYWEVGIGHPQYAGSNKWWIIRDHPEQFHVDGWMDIPAEPKRSV
ncbi:hypothetical protein [Delftia phage PhiW-14]|uniref:DUF551 domain-containing protein n=1 Tax=Delftia phage PhiW-14 TaxID=665032 RepID=C9DGF7_BPW14|nr:hypothetical protein DP-phiW-14_gp187 [Delftia phage PhiW-14]ACV50208.1 hypothetical protein [Delftia phage PhiW-14]